MTRGEWGEPLNETMCGCRECHCKGLIVRGTHSLLLTVSLWTTSWVLSGGCSFGSFGGP